MKPVVLIGAGGHASVVLEMLELQSIEVVGVVDPVLDPDVHGPNGLPVLTDECLSKSYPADRFDLANGVGMLPGQQSRKNAYKRLSDEGYAFPALVHPRSILAQDAVLVDGVQIMAGATIQHASEIGCNVIVNTGAQVDHHCRVGDNCHIAPGAILCGGVILGDDVFVGAGAVIINNISIGEKAVIGAGAIITRDIPAGVRTITPISKDVLR
jgi:sugar O-acyltransferase (sialic acid O-acetyltransferase NeuD family)